MDQSNAKIKHVGPLSKMFDDYTSNSTVHGVKYLGERRRHWSEKFFWIIAFLVSISGCSIFIGKMYIKWNLSPVISSYTEIKAAAFQIPFPAITICPLVKVKSKFLRFENNSRNDPFLAIDALLQVCVKDFYLSIKQNSGLKVKEIVPTLHKIAPKLNETIKNCIWSKKKELCKDYFTEIMTDEGLCFTFNMLDSSEIFRDEVLDEDFVSLKHNEISKNWSLQGGYTTFDKDTYPKRILETDSKSGLRMWLKELKNNYDWGCSGLLRGFKVILHTPGEIPQGSKNFFYASSDEIVHVSIKPHMITTLEGLTDYSPEKRECFLSHEKYLKFFKIYTQSNCELECLANFTLNACGCVTFSMPRGNNTLICSTEQMYSYRTAANDLMEAELKNNWKSTYVVGYKNSSYSPCNCLPECNSINYDYEVDRTDFKIKKLNLKYKGFDFKNYIYSKLIISIKEPQISVTTRSENYGIFEFLGNCGGILGIFMGVSLISIIEIIYHFTFRPAYNLRCQNKVLFDGLHVPTIETDDKQSDNVSYYDQMDVDNNLGE